MFKYLLILISMMFINVSFAQDWCWERNDELLNPSGIKTLGMNTPFTGDFDGDGDIDLIVGCKGGVVQYYENIGTPDSAIWQMDEDYFASLELDTLLAPQPSLVDLDGDSLFELYLTFVDNGYGTPADSLQKFINTGTPQNPTWEQVELNIGYNFYGLCGHQFVDFDSDSDLDLVFTSIPWYGEILYYFENTGTYTDPIFQLNDMIFEDFIPPYVGEYLNFKLADIYGDDELELVAIIGAFDHDVSEIIFFTNIGSNSNPDWEEHNYLLESSYWTNISFTDFDNDNDLDFFLGNYHVPLYYNENLGAPDSIYVLDVFNGQQLGPLFVAWCENICFVDYDNDYDFDFTFFYLMRSYWDEYSILSSATNIGSTFFPIFDFSVGFMRGFWVVDLDEFYLSSEDLNGDGFPELAISYCDGLRYFVNDNGNGIDLGNMEIIEIGEPNYYRHLELADLNNDGLTDLLICHESELTWKCFRNTGTPQEPAWTESPDWIAGIDSNIAVYRGANINNDNRIDLIGVDENWHLQGYINTGTGDEVSFAYSPEIFADWQDYPVRYYDCVDIDGDGDDDVLVDSVGVINLIENMTLLKITESDAILPQQFTLYQNYPNPFNASTTISFVLADKSEVDLTVYDITGRLVKNIHSGIISPGEYSFIWYGRNNQGKQLSSGVYFYKLTYGYSSTTRRMVYLK